MKVEPYVYCGNVTGPEHQHPGYARNAWLSGTASWTYVAGTQWILGIRPTYQGLRISPCIPDKWSGFKAERVFRGVRYLIEVERSGKGERIQLIVNGKKITGSVVPMPPAGTRDQTQVDLRESGMSVAQHSANQPGPTTSGYAGP
jgi:cellobiose phosphorylase